MIYSYPEGDEISIGPMYRKVPEMKNAPGGGREYSYKMATIVQMVRG